LLPTNKRIFITRLLKKTETIVFGFFYGLY